MKWWLVGLSLLLLGQSVFASPYGRKLCKTNPNYDCMRVGGKGWYQISRNRQLYKLVQLVNRVNVGLNGTIAVPKNLKEATPESVSPFPIRMPSAAENVMVVDLKHMAWAAYDTNGMLIRWGAISPGKKWCNDTNESCSTTPGSCKVYRKGGAGCESRKYPPPWGGARMPYCSFFNGGIAVHGGYLPGRPDSHGCVRTSVQDARWLSTKFLRIGTKVEVRPFREI